MPRHSKNFKTAQTDFCDKITKILETTVLDETVVLDDFSIKELENIIRMFEDTKSDFTTISRFLMNAMREKIKHMDDKEQTKKIRINKGAIR